MQHGTNDERWRLTWGVLALISCVIVASCSCRSGHPGAERAAEAAFVPRRGGVLTIATPGIISTFEPVLAGASSSVNVWTLAHLLGRLVRTGRDGRSIEPDLAESWQISADGRVYTFQLRPLLKFSDGSPLRASDVRFSLLRATKDRRNPYQQLFPPLEIAAPDDHTVVVKLETAYAPLLASLTLCSMSILSEAHVQRVGEKGLSESPLGSGPFVLTKWKPGDRIILRRNPLYWDQGRPYLDEVRVLAIPDEMTRMLKVQAGEVDAATVVPFNLVDSLRRSTELTVQVTPSLEISFLGLNRRVAALNDPKVRQALFFAIDREALLRAVLFGHGALPASFLPRLLYTGEIPLSHDLAKAKQLLAESSFPSGFSVSLLIFSQSIQQQVAVLLRSQLDPLGIRVQIQQVESAQYWQRLQKKDTEMTVLGGRADTFDPAELTQFTVASGGFVAALNGYRNPDVDELISKAQAATSPKERAALYRQLEQLVLQDVPYVPLFLLAGRDAIRNNVHELTALPTSDTYRLWDVWKSQ